MKRLFLLLLIALSAPLAAQTIDLPGPSTVAFEPLVNRSVDIGERLVAEASMVSDKCGHYGEAEKASYARLVARGEGYYYDDLLADIDEWKKSPYLAGVRSIGTTVEEREIYELTITDPGSEGVPRHRVTIHARTHPHEIQSSWVADAIIKFLLSDDPYAALLRQNVRFHIYPMYNPDGVERNSTRYNANGVDLEREWDKAVPEPEAAALKARFDQLMKSEQPIEVALNLHSSSDPERYFWFHDENGTSARFAELQRAYIASVRESFAKIMPWDYRVSWKSAAPTHFPESWFWHNHGTGVMALTYEEIFSQTLESNGEDFIAAGRALLDGIGDYLQIRPTSVESALPAASPLDLR